MTIVELYIVKLIERLFKRVKAIAEGKVFGGIMRIERDSRELMEKTERRTGSE